MPKPTVGQASWGQTLNDFLDTLTLTFNVVEYDATGDGTTDDIVGINAAVTAASAAGGGVVFFPAGTYRVSSAVLLPSGVTLRGAGPGATVIKLADGVDGQHVVDYGSGGQSNVAVVDLTIDGNKAATTGTCDGISLVTVTGALVQNVTVRNTRTRGIDIYQSSRVTVRDVRVIDCGTADDGDVGTYVGVGVYCDTAVLDGVEVSGASGIGIGVTGASSGVTVTSCRVSNCGHIGIALGGGASTDLLVQGCVVAATGDNGIDTGNATEVIVANCVVRDAGVSGICMDGGAYQSFVGNVVYSPAQKGIDVSTSTNGGCLVDGNSVIEPGQHGIQVVGVDHCTVTGNTVRNTGEFWSGISIYGSDRAVVTGNRVTDSRATKLTQFGVYVSGDSSNCRTAGNLLDALSAGYYDDSTGSGNTAELVGVGTPEGVVGAGVGSTFLRTDGGAGSTFYVKETGAGNTGWVAK